MALQTDGTISLNDIHVEAGGSSGTLVGINDSDVRGLTGASSGASSSFNSFYGASSAWSRTMTVGHAGHGPSSIHANATGVVGKLSDTNNGGSPYVGSGTGTLSPNNLFDNGAAVFNLMFNVRVPVKNDMTFEFNFQIAGHYPNSGWNNLLMDDGMGGTITIPKSSLTYTQEPTGGFFGWPYPTTLWRRIYNQGSGDNQNNNANALRANYFRSGIGHKPPAHSGVPTPAVKWLLGAQINVTIN